MEENKENTTVENTEVNERKNGFQENGDYRLDLTQTQEQPEASEPETPEVDQLENEDAEPVETADNQEVTQEEEFVALTEITDEPEPEVVDEPEPEVIDEVKEEVTTEEPDNQVPEDLQKLWNFMQETGGTVEDYVKLNQDYDKLNEVQLLKEYYETTKPYLDKEDIDLLLEDFSYDEELDDDRDIRKKKIAYKEELKRAKDYLSGLKDQYYKELKQGARLTPEAQEALVYKQEREEASKIAQQQQEVFLNQTKKVFSEEFKGFDFSVGDKKYRFNVNNVDEVKTTQSDIGNFIGKFLDEKGNMSDAKGYHRALYVAMNADKIAQHFYNQGKADQVRESGTARKNIDMDPNSVHTDAPKVNGVTFRVID